MSADNLMFEQTRIMPDHSNVEGLSRAAAILLGAEADVVNVDPEVEKAREILVDLGVLTPTKEVPMYHGRVDTDAGNKLWIIDPDHKSGKFNVNTRRCVYTTSDKQVATEFGQRRGYELCERNKVDILENDIKSEDPEVVRDRIHARAFERWSVEPYQEFTSYNLATKEPTIIKKSIPKPVRPETGLGLLTKRELYLESSYRLQEMSDDDRNALWKRAVGELGVHINEILPTNKSATLLNMKFDFGSLEKMQQDEIAQSIEVVLDLLDYSHDSNLDTKTREFVKKFTLNRGKEKPRLKINEIEDLQNAHDLEGDDLTTLLAIENSKSLLRENLLVAVQKYLDTPRNICYEDFKPYEPDRVPLNMSYISMFLQKLGVVGLIGPVISSSLGHREIQAISLFDLNQVAAVK